MTGETHTTKGLAMRASSTEVKAGRSLKTLLAAVLAIGAVAALPAGASAHGHGKTAERVRANSAGSDAPPTLPSIVRVRIARGTKALEHAGDYVDRDLPDRAVASLLNARRNMYAAWRGARYVIEHPPPAPPAEDARASSPRAHASDDDAVGTVYASPEETGFAVLGFQHTVATEAYGLLDDAKGVLRDALSTTMFAALDRRDASIAYIHALPVPDPEAELPEGTITWDMLMPGLIPDLDDELQDVEGLLEHGALTPGEKRIMNEADAQILRTERNVNLFWPPVVGD
jgi:hypothetical protein